MLDGYRLFTLTHRHAGLDQLEPYAIATEKVPATIGRLCGALGWEEAFYLSTCNRVLFFFYQDRAAVPPSICEFQTALGVDPKASGVKPVYLEGEAAVLHLYDVAASIDSMVVGEREILRQLRLSYLACHEAGHCGDHIRLVMQSAVAAAKEVYHRTRIGQKPVSVVSLAAQRIAQQRLAPDSRVLMVGAGQTNWLISKFLQRQGFTNVTVANRTLANAQRLARVYGGKAIALDDLAGYEGGFDLLIVCTASTRPTVNVAEFEQLLNGEGATEKVVVDLSIPHNVDPEVVEAYQPTYIQIDDLRKLAQSNLAFREREVSEARLLIEAQLASFRESVQQRRIERALSGVPGEIKEIRKRAIAEVFSRDLERLKPETRELIERMMHYMERKCIGVPMRAARRAAVVAPRLKTVPHLPAEYIVPETADVEP